MVNSKSPSINLVYIMIQVTSLSLIILSGVAMIYGFPQESIKQVEMGSRELTSQTLFSGENGYSRFIFGDQRIILNEGVLRFYN